MASSVDSISVSMHEGGGAGDPYAFRIVLTTDKSVRDGEIRLAAADRLTAQHENARGLSGGSSEQGGGGSGAIFLRNARAVGIDTTLLWALMDSDRSRVAEACLAVVGAGRTAMVFISGTTGPSDSANTGNRDNQVGRVALIRHACAHVVKLEPPPVGGAGARLAQALLEPQEWASIDAFEAAGFTRLGNLAYLRRSSESLAGLDESPGFAELRTGVKDLGEGLEAWSVAALKAAGTSEAEIDRLLVEAMTASYEDTLDCPELCGLRDTADVLASHKAVGAFDPSLWWVVLATPGSVRQGVGCLLLTPCPEQDSVELVYLGLGASIRGRGLARRLFADGLRTLQKKNGLWSTLLGAPAINGGVTCAVDMRNAPALSLYRGMGFQQFATRVPLVKGLDTR